jgi:hypothetical protein
MSGRRHASVRNHRNAVRLPSESVSALRRIPQGVAVGRERQFSKRLHHGKVLVVGDRLSARAVAVRTAIVRTVVAGQISVTARKNVKSKRRSSG